MGGSGWRLDEITAGKAKEWEVEAGLGVVWSQGFVASGLFLTANRQPLTASALNFSFPVRRARDSRLCP